MKKIIRGVVLAIVLAIGICAAYTYFHTRTVSPSGNHIVRYKVEEGWWKRATHCIMRAKHKDGAEYVEESLATIRMEPMDVQTEWIDDDHCKLELYLDGVYQRGVIIVFGPDEEVTFRVPYKDISNGCPS